jgi:hypothetical protein
MTTGDVILVHGEKLLQRAIQWFQGLIYTSGWRWNHAGLIVCFDGEPFVCEATAKGIVFTPFKDFEGKDFIIGAPVQPIPDELKDDIARFCLPHAGNVRYDFVNLLVEQPVKIISKELIGREIWIGARNDKRATRRFICGEWVAYVYHRFFNCFENYPEIDTCSIYNSGLFNWSKNQNP